MLWRGSMFKQLTGLAVSAAILSSALFGPWLHALTHSHDSGCSPDLASASDSASPKKAVCHHHHHHGAGSHGHSHSHGSGADSDPASVPHEHSTPHNSHDCSVCLALAQCAESQEAIRIETQSALVEVLPTEESSTCDAIASPATARGPPISC